MLFNPKKIILLLFLSGWFIPVFAQLSESERETKAEELRQLQLKIKNITAEQQKVRDQYDVVQTELRKTEQAISRGIKTIKRLNQKLAKKNKKLKALFKQQQQLEKQVAKQRTLLGQQIRAAYMTGKQAYIKLLLNQQDPATMGRVMKYYDYLNQARKQQIDDALETLQALEKVAEKIRLEKQKIEKLKATQLVEKKELLAAKHKRSKVITELSQRIQSKQQALNQLRTNEHDLKVLLEAIVDILTAPQQHKSFQTFRGKMRWPVKGRVRHVYGKLRNNSKVRWNGVVIDAREGSEVRAIARGRVAYADWLRGYGLLLIIDHGDGYMSLYGHNQSLVKEVGDWVEINEVISTVGMSGGQKKSALYFEIRKNGQPNNPGKWCTRSQARG